MKSTKRDDGYIRARVSREEREQVNLALRFFRARAKWLLREPSDYPGAKDQSACVRSLITRGIEFTKGADEDFRRFMLSEQFRAEYEADDNEALGAYHPASAEEDVAVTACQRRARKGGR